MKVLALFLVLVGYAGGASADVPAFAKKLLRTYKQSVSKRADRMRSTDRANLLLSELAFADCVATFSRLGRRATETERECSPRYEGNSFMWFAQKIDDELEARALTPSIFVLPTEVIHRASDEMLRRMTTNTARQRAGFALYGAPVIQRAYTQWITASMN